MIPTLFGRATAVLGEHARLHALVAQLRSLDGGGDLQTPAGTDLRSLVGEFCGKLKTHFAAEESDGYFGTLVTECPSLRPAVAHLLDEHRHLLVVCGRLMALVEIEGQSGEIAVTLRTLFERFDEHERSEALLVREYFRHSGNPNGL